MFAYCGNNPVQYADPIGTHAVAIGIGISAFMVGGFTYSVSIIFDFHGNIALQLTKADVFQDKTGAVVGFASAGTSVNFSYNTADTVNNLEGITYNYGGSGNVYGPVTVGGKYNRSDFDDWGVTLSCGLGIGYDGHISATETNTIAQFNLMSAE